MKVEIGAMQLPPLYIEQVQTGETFQLSLDNAKDVYLMIADSKANGWKVLCLNDNKHYPLSDFKSEPLKLIKTKIILDN